jgi:transmembrane E3 ubiquitin-protein ligase
VFALVVRVVVAPGLAVVLLAVLYSSIWVPQIVRATRRGRPCALGRRYVIGTTVGRMLIALCTHLHCTGSASLTNATRACGQRFPGMPEKCDGRGTARYVVPISPLVPTDSISTAWVYVLCAFVCVQATVLGLQASFGPAFFLPSRVRYLF